MYRRVSFLLFYSFCNANVIGSAIRVAKNQSSIQASSECVGCNNSVENNLDEFLRMQKIAHRLEYIEEQISNSLLVRNTNEQSSNLEPLPDFLIDRLIHGDKKNENEDFTSRQMLLFPEEGEIRHCPPAHKNNICLKFKLSESFSYVEIKSAVIWLNENIFENNKEAQNITIMDRRNSYAQERRTNGLTLNPINKDGGWYQIDVTSKVKSWQVYQNSNYGTLIVSCHACDNIISKNATKERTKMPFLLLNTKIQRNLRYKRGVDCSPGSSNNECCRDNLEVDFNALAEYKMILYPPKFNAYVCRGNCYYPSAIDSKTPYATLLVKLKLNNIPLPASCCTPTKFSSLSVIYANDKFNYEQVNIPNMIVESCGCV